MSYLELLKLASPEAIVTLTALVVLAIGVASGRGTVVAGVSPAKPQESAAGTAASTVVCTLVAVAGLIVAITAIVMLPPNADLFRGMLVNSLFNIVCLVLAFFTILLASRETSNYGEYLAIILLATIGLLLLVGSEELLMIFIGLELTGLSLYLMTAFDKFDIRSAEAGLKYFLFGSTASAFTLFGLSLIYGITGTTSFSAIAGKLNTQMLSPLLFAGIAMTLVGFAFKIAAAPFHLWAPDAYQGAPVSSAAFIASGSKVASFVVLGKIMLVGFSPPQSLMGGTRCLDESQVDVKDLARPCSILQSMRSPYSARSEWLLWCAARPAATICKTLLGYLLAHRCSPVAWRFSCCH